LVRAVCVVVPLIGGQDTPSVGLIEDEEAVERFAPDGTHDPLAMGVHPGSPWRALDHFQSLSLEDGAEGVAVLTVLVTQQKAQ
jgi:hypothetical protein